MDDELIILVGVVALVIYTVSLHELGHAYTATYFGDPTPGRHGRLTFNPLVQLHPFYSVLMPILSYYSMGWPVGWAFCPVDPSRFKRPLRDNALTSLAGPLVNFAAAAFFIGLLWVPGLAPNPKGIIFIPGLTYFPQRDPPSFNFAIFAGVAFWNLVLGVFNLLPLPGLDGYDVCRPLLPLRMRRPLDDYRRMGFLPLFVAILVGPRILGGLWPYLIELFVWLLPGS